MKLPIKIDQAVDQIGKLPGIGEKTALRQVLAILNWSREEIIDFSKSIAELNNVKNCTECGLVTEQELCSICVNASRRNSGIICVVETVKDCLAIERAGQFHGGYHILGGVLNPLMGVGPDNLNLEKLFERLRRQQIVEVILAINPSIEGDATCSYIRDKIDQSIRVERIGFGIPMGGSLEYLDQRTISKAFEFRRPF